MNNLERLEKKHPLLHFLLGHERQITPPSHDGATAEIVPADEEVDVLFVFGLRDGSSYPILQPWLGRNNERSLVYLEESLPRLKAFLESPFARQLLENPQVAIAPAGSDQYRALAWEHLFKKFAIARLPDAEGDEESLREFLLGVRQVAYQYREFGADVMRNVFRNMITAETFTPASTLFDTCNNVPALICGAGPSLDKQIPHLRNAKGKALVIAGGSAIRILEEKGVAVDLAAMIDPEAPTERFCVSKTPLAFLHRAKPEIVELFTGEKLEAASNEMFPLEKHLMEQVGIEEEPFDAGWDVSTFSAALAVKMGCSPIIFVGMDHSHPADRFYAKGVLHPEKGREMLPAKDLHGNPVFTSADFLLGVSWLADLAKAHPKTVFCNATEGGLPIEGIANRPLKEAIEGLLGPTPPLRGKSQPLSPDATRKAVCAIADSARRCSRIVQSWIAALGQSDQKQQLLAEADLLGEMFYREHMIPMWTIFQLSVGEELLPKLLFYQRMIDPFIAMLEKEGL